MDFLKFIPFGAEVVKCGSRVICVEPKNWILKGLNEYH
jgi:hypothetical protein